MLGKNVQPWFEMGVGSCSSSDQRSGSYREDAANTVVHDFIDAVKRQASIEWAVGLKVMEASSPGRWFGQTKFMVLKVQHDLRVRWSQRIVSHD